MEIWDKVKITIDKNLIEQTMYNYNNKEGVISNIYKWNTYPYRVRFSGIRNALFKEEELSIIANKFKFIS